MIRAFWLAIIFLGSPFAQAAGVSFTEPFRQIHANMSQALALQAQGQGREAAELVSDTYFDVFEASGIETAIAARSSSLKTGLESQFNEIRSAMMGHIERPKLEAKVNKFLEQLQAVELQLSNAGSSWWDKFLSSMMIIVREGFEAILIVGAITAFLIKSGNRKYLALIRSSVFSAIGASLVLAGIFTFVFRLSAARQELMEGVTMLIACAVLFTVGHWLIARAESEHWMRYIRHSVADSLSTKSQRALWFTCFLAVFREGAETVLFYQALWSSAEASSRPHVIAGFVVGCFLLAVIYFVFKTGILRIPMKPFFRVTSSLLYYLAFVFAGQAVVELQAGGYLLVHEVPVIPTIHALGIYPTVESIALQSFVLLALLGSLIYVYLFKKEKAPHVTPALPAR